MITWIPIPDYENLYEVSSLGEIRTSAGRLIGRILHPSTSDRGYRKIILTKNGIRKSHKVARLVARAFIPNPKDLPEVNHMSGNKFDDSACNLEWATHAQNIQHAYDTGLKRAKKNEEHPMCVLTDEQVAYIRSHYATGWTSLREMAELFGVSKRQIGRVVHGQSRG